MMIPRDFHPRDSAPPKMNPAYSFEQLRAPRPMSTARDKPSLARPEPTAQQSNPRCARKSIPRLSASPWFARHHPVLGSQHARFRAFAPKDCAVLLTILLAVWHSNCNLYSGQAKSRKSNCCIRKNPQLRFRSRCHVILQLSPTRPARWL